MHRIGQPTARLKVALQPEGLFIPAGIASDEQTALGSQADVALVDLNLQDGPTGITIGRELSKAHGVTVVFMTANPSQLGDGVAGAVGVLP